MKLKLLVAAVTLFLAVHLVSANADAKRLYDDLLSNYNRLVLLYYSYKLITNI
jgi:hypothetical protein